MKKIIWSFIIGLLLITPVQASELDFKEMKATAYCLQGQTASGEYTREGICAGRPEWIGKTIAVYYNDNGKIGDFLGYYEIKDTGAEPIKKGYVIDIWMEDKESCKQFGTQNVYVLIIGE